MIYPKEKGLPTAVLWSHNVIISPWGGYCDSAGDTRKRALHPFSHRGRGWVLQCRKNLMPQAYNIPRSCQERKSFLSLFQHPASLFRDIRKRVAILPVYDAIPVVSDELLAQFSITALKHQHLWLQPKEPEVRECKPQAAAEGFTQLCPPKKVTDLTSSTQANKIKSKH